MATVMARSGEVAPAERQLTSCLPTGNAGRSKTVNAEETVRKQESAINAHDARAFAACYATAATVTDPFYPEPLAGRDAIEKDMADFFTALPDIRITAAKVLVDGDTV